MTPFVGDDKGALEWQQIARDKGFEEVRVGHARKRPRVENTRRAESISADPALSPQSIPAHVCQRRMHPPTGDRSRQEAPTPFGALARTTHSSVRRTVLRERSRRIRGDARPIKLQLVLEPDAPIVETPRQQEDDVCRRRDRQRAEPDAQDGAHPAGSTRHDEVANRLTRASRRPPRRPGRRTPQTTHGSTGSWRRFDRSERAGRSKATRPTDGGIGRKAAATARSRRADSPPHQSESNLDLAVPGSRSESPLGSWSSRLNAEPPRRCNIDADRRTRKWRNWQTRRT